MENLRHSAESYEAAKQRLERKFGGIRRQVALQLEAVDNFRPLRAGSAIDLDRFADLLDLTVINLRESGRYDELGCGSMYHKIIKKMDEAMNASFQRWLFEHQRVENVENLRHFILQEAEFRTIASEVVHGLSKIEVSSQRRNPNLKSSSYFGQNDDVTTKTCECCGGYHPIWKCEVFSQKTVDSRWKLAIEKHLCFRCLGSSHRGSTCTRSRLCGLEGCMNTHHRLLHGRYENRQLTSVRPLANVRTVIF